MSTFARICIAVAAFLLTAALVVVGLVTFTDPNRFKAPIASLLHERSGLWVDLEGDLAWSLRPTLRVEARDVRADWVANAAKPFATVKRLSIGIDPLAVLMGSGIQLKDVVLEGLALDLVRDRVGRGNWQPATADRSEAEGTAESTLTFDRLEIVDGTVRYRDTGSQQALDATDLDIDAEDVRIGQAFPLEAHARFALVKQAVDVHMNLNTQITLRPSSMHFVLDDLVMSGWLTRGRQDPVSYRLAGAMESDGQAGTGRLDIDSFTFADATLRLATEVSNLYEIPRLRGHLELDVPQSRILSDALGVGEIPIRHVGLAGDFDLRGQAGKVTGLRLRLDDLLMSGTVELVDAVVPELAFDLATDTVALDRYFDTSHVVAGAARPTEAALIDPAWFQGLNWKGHLAAKRITAGGLTFGDVALATSNRNGVVTNSANIGSVLEGSLKARVELDARATPKLEATVEMTNLQGGPMLALLGSGLQMQGRIGGTGEVSGSGASTAAIADSLAGKVRFKSDKADFVLGGNRSSDTHIEGAIGIERGALRSLDFEIEGPLLELSALAPAGTTTPADTPSPDTPIFDAHALDGIQWNGHAKFARVRAPSLAIQDAELSTRLRDRVISSSLRIGSMLGGSVSGDASVDAHGAPAWKTALDAHRIDAQTLIDWLGLTAEVHGRLEAHADVAAKGNSLETIADSLTGELGFSSNQGTANIKAIKDVASALEVIANRPGTVGRWPDVIDYKRLTGSLGLAGLGKQRFDFNLDNLVVEGKGGYDVAAKTVDYDVSITFRNLPQYYTFDVPPLFLDVSFPVRCKGRLSSNSLCALSKDAAGKIVAQLLRNEIQHQLLKGLERILVPPSQSGN